MSSVSFQQSATTERNFGDDFTGCNGLQLSQDQKNRSCSSLKRDLPPYSSLKYGLDKDILTIETAARYSITL